MDTELSGKARAEIVRIRAQLDDLLSERVAPAVSGAMDRAQSAAQHQLEAVTERVRGQPLMAMLAAAGIGFLLGRIWR
jgi:ElaB/YqjD/DUF883 family membrane-anchored ribosome-binding protein